MGAVAYTIQQVIDIAKISQVLINADIRAANFSTNQVLDKRHPRLLYMERRALEWYNTYGTNTQVLSDIANYVLGLCGTYVQRALSLLNSVSVSGPVITGPVDQSVNEGDDATFSVSVSGAAPFVYQWYYYLGNPIPGATASAYTLTDAQTSDSGHTFYVRITDANGKTATSAVATLTVTAVITGFLSYGDVDPASALQASTDPFTYPNTFNITHNASISIPIPVPAAVNKFIIAKIPIGESVKNTWFNTSFNNGTIPDFNWQAFVQFGGFTYYYTRQAISLDSSQPLILSAV